MELVLRAAALYFVLMLFFRISGKRALGDMTTFDFVLLLIIAETTQQALVGRNYSITASVILIGTLIGIDIALSLVKRRFPRADKLLEGMPVVLLERGRLHQDRLRRERVDEQDILEAGRASLGLRSLEEIEYAVLEKNGTITVVPRRDGSA